PCTDQPPTEISPLSLHDALPILIVTHRHVTIDADDGKSLLVGAQRAPARPAHVEPVDTEGGDGEVGVVPRAEDCDIGQVETETRSEEHTSELQSLAYLVCRLLLE